MEIVKDAQCFRCLYFLRNVTRPSIFFKVPKLNPRVIATAAFLWFFIAASAHAGISLRSSSSGTGIGGPATHGANGTFSAANNAVSSITLASPASVNLGDFMLLQVAVKTPSAIPVTPAGWTLLTSKVDSGLAQYVYRQTASSTSYQPTVDFTTTGLAGGARASSRAVMGLTSFGNLTASPVEAFGSTSATLSLTATAPTLSASQSGELLVSLFAAGSGGEMFSTPTGMTLDYSVTTSAGANGVAIGSFYQTLPSSGASGARASTIVQADNSGINILLTAVNTASVANLTVPAPAGLAAGDVMVASVSFSNSAQRVSAPSGWTLQTSSVQSLGAGEALLTYTKVAGSSEPSSYTWSATGGSYNYSAGEMLDFTGVDTVSPALSSSSAAPSSAVNFNLSTPSITPSVSGSMVVASFSNLNADTWSAPAGFTQDISPYAPAAKSASGISLSMDHLLQSTAASIGATSTAGSTYAADYGASSIIALRPYVPGPASFALTPSSTAASTCSALSISVTAKNAAGSTLTTYVGTIALSTSTGHGTWAKASGSGTFSSSSDTGVASYSFASTDNGTASFTLLDTHAESLSATATDSSSSVASSSSSIAFSDNALVINSSDALAYDVVSGRAHALTVGFYKKDASTGLCGINTLYTGSKALDFWIATTGSHPSGAASPSIASSATNGTCSSPVALPSAAPSSNPSSNLISLAFASGQASFFLCPSDAGQYTLSARDDTRAFASSDISGASSTLTARPFALTIDQVAYGAASNPSGSASSGSAFAPAQSSFTLRVNAKNWAFGQDATTAGAPDAGADLSGNAYTSSFKAVASLSGSAQTPSAGVLGSLGTASVASLSFSSGQAASVAQTYSEAGSFKVTAASSNYLGSGFSVPGQASASIGRFYPARITLASSSVSNACATGAFTYMGQPFNASAVLKAYGSSGGLLTNYDASLGYAFTLSPSWRAVDAQDGADRSSRLAMGVAPTWSSGTWGYSNSTASFARLSSGPDGQYDSFQLGLSGADPDGAAISSMDMGYASAGACSGASCNAKSVGAPMRQRFGRLELSNAFGAVLPTLRIPAVAKYWTRSAGGAALGFSLNTLDSCTSIPYADMALGGYQGALSSASLPSGSMTLSSGAASILVSRSGNSAVSGSVYLGINLGSSSAAPNSCAAGLGLAAGAAMAYLQSNFCSATYSANPNASVIWGAANGKSSSTIMLREIY